MTNLAELPVAGFAEGARRHLATLPWGQSLDETLFMKVCSLLQSRTPLYTQSESWKYFFVDPIEYDEKAVQKTLKKEGVKAALVAVRDNLVGGDFSEAAIQQAIRKAESALGINEGKLNQPLRIAVTGVTTGAGIYETMAILGRDRSMARLEHTINTVLA